MMNEIWTDLTLKRSPHGKSAESQNNELLLLDRLLRGGGVAFYVGLAFFGIKWLRNNIVVNGKLRNTGTSKSEKESVEKHLNDQKKENYDTMDDEWITTRQLVLEAQQERADAIRAKRLVYKMYIKELYTFSSCN